MLKEKINKIIREKSNKIQSLLKEKNPIIKEVDLLENNMYNKKLKIIEIDNEIVGLQNEVEKLETAIDTIEVVEKHNFDKKLINVEHETEIEIEV